MLDVQHAHFVRIRYHGPTNSRGSCLSASWEGWPSDDGRKVRRTFAYTSDSDAMARQAADMFCAWLNSGDLKLTFSADQIILAGMTGDDWALLIHTKAEPVK